MKNNLIDFVFKKKQKEKEAEVNKKRDIDIDLNELEAEEKEKKENNIVSKGMTTLKDMICPAGFDRTDENCIGVGGKYVRSFVVKGYPSQVYVSWLDDIYSSEEDLDVSYHVVPADPREAEEGINMEITKQEAQLRHERKSGKIDKLGKMEYVLSELYAQRDRLEKGIEKLYHSCIVINLHANSKEELDKASYRVEHILSARKIDIMSSYLRQDDSYKSALPFGVNYMEDKFRNMNTGGLVASFPFYNGNISHKNGVFLGLNTSNGNPVFVNFFDKSLANPNVAIFGASGSGKTFLVKLMTMRGMVKGRANAIIDPEGEFAKSANQIGGKVVKISLTSDTKINPFDVKCEINPDTKKQEVNVKDKVGDLMNLIGVMVGGLDPEQQSIVSVVLTELYEKDFEINKDPNSLFVEDTFFNEETGEFVYAGVEKIMPTLSDFYNKLSRYVEGKNKENLNSLVNSLTMYTKGNVHDIFDGQTSESLKDLSKEQLIVYDVSKIESSSLRPVAMYSCLTWLWETWVKKDHKREKSLIVEECWMMVDKNIPGTEYTAAFLNVAARRCRKRNTSLVVSSQSFHEFIENPLGKAVLQNTAVKMLLKTEPVAVDSVQETFKLSDGERNFIMSAPKGQVLMKIGCESDVVYVMPFEYEKEMIENPFDDNDKNIIGDGDYE